MAEVRYLVDDVERAVAFYTGQLGFHEIERWGSAVSILERGDLRLWLSGPQTSAAKPMPDGRTPEPGGWNRIVLTVDDLSSLVERMRGDGVVFRNEILSGPGGSQILAEDGVGNIVELFEPRARSRATEGAD